MIESFYVVMIYGFNVAKSHAKAQSNNKKTLRYFASLREKIAYPKSVVRCQQKTHSKKSLSNFF